ncbi:hypothetical protein E1180_11095 [Roseibium denhamense]|nr:hypothetical protein [Roseibium denhamense]MTI06059.1 hypothetical protein [Roseibium denhamense]
MAKPTLKDFVAAKISAGERIEDDDVLTLRRYIYGDMVVSADEASALFRLNNAKLPATDSWHHLFPEAIGDILVNQVRPEGYVSEENAAWLIGQVTADGHICTANELEAVLKVLEKARQAPASLEQFALQTVASSVISGDGPTRHGKALKPGVISDAEVELLRRVLYAGAGCGGIAVSKAEAEVLFDLNDATIEAENSPAWSELFAKAVANYMMAMSGYTPPPRDVALAREDWLAQPGGFQGGIAGFFKSMFGGGPDEAVSSDPFADRGAAMSAEIAANEVVTAVEAGWLIDRIGRDGLLHENEKALLRFIQQESPDIHPALRPLMDRAL